MESHVFNQQGIIRTASDVFRTMQLARDISMDDEQHLLGIIVQRSTSQLYGRLRHTSKNNERTGEKDNQVLEDSGEAQFVFQTI